MHRIDYRNYLKESISGIEVRCLNSYRCWYFESAYKCRAFLRSYGYTDALTVCVGGAYLPMPRELYRKWRSLNRELAELDSEPEYI